MKEFILNNWEILLPAALAVAWAVVRLTPTKKDDRIMKVISYLVNSIIPDVKKDGGTHDKKSIWKRIRF